MQGLTPGVNTTLPSRHAHLIISLDAPITVRQMSNEAPPAAPAATQTPPPVAT